jgi:hypothetical protein
MKQGKKRSKDFRSSYMVAQGYNLKMPERVIGGTRACPENPPRKY